MGLVLYILKMFTNYSQTYAAAIATYAPIAVLILGKFGITILQADFIVIASAIVASVGFLWQIIHRYLQGGVNIVGGKV